MSELIHGYHLSHIFRGEYGKFSKIEEELLEFKDALEQECKIMALHELSDMLGAMEAFLYNYQNMHFSLEHIYKQTSDKMGDASQISDMFLALKIAVHTNKKLILIDVGNLLYAIQNYLNKEYPSFNLKDLYKMAEITARAFNSGHRRVNL